MNIKESDGKLNLKALSQKHPWSIPIAGVFVALCLAWLSSDHSTPIAVDDVSIDTFVPKGFTLVPITVQNSESLDAVLGKFGVVDLFSTGRDGKATGKAVAKSIKMIRAPKNPSQFGVLIPDEQVGLIVKHIDPYFVVVHGPDHSGTKFEDHSRRGSRAIVYDQEDP